MVDTTAKQAAGHWALSLRRVPFYAEVGADAPEGEYTSLEVSDTGPGIDPEVRGKMFDPFLTTERRAQGPGMGLAIALAAVRQHHGVIKVSSQMGRGVCLR